jgi:hypothetical protein
VRTKIAIDKMRVGIMIAREGINLSPDGEQVAGLWHYSIDIVALRARRSAPIIGFV